MGIQLFLLVNVYILHTKKEEDEVVILGHFCFPTLDIVLFGWADSKMIIIFEAYCIVSACHQLLKMGEN